MTYEGSLVMSVERSKAYVLFGFPRRILASVIISLSHIQVQIQVFVFFIVLLNLKSLKATLPPTL